MKPTALQIGDQIGVVAPASAANSARLKKAVTLLMMMGYDVKIGESAKQKYGYLAGSDEIRAKDLNDMFADPQVKAIFCLRGGYGSARILPLLDYESIKQNPKIVVGYSDITALHLALHQKAGLITFHGPVLTELTESFHPLTGLHLFAQCAIPQPMGTYPTPKEAYTLTAGTVQGELIGGNLSLLTASLGTPYEVDTMDKILFIEEIGEEPYRIDRMLTQLLQAGKLQTAQGIVLTSFTDCDPALPEKSLSLSTVFQDRVGFLGIPAYFGLKAGHTSPNLTVPIGGRVEMHAAKCRLTCLEGNVI